MISIYSPGNNNTASIGDCVLQPSSCPLEANLGGSWTLTLEHPIDDDGRWMYIEENAVLKVPTWLANKYQLYRIKTVTKTDTAVSAVAYPIFFDTADNAYIFDIRAYNKTSNQMLTQLFAAAPSTYSFETDLTTRSSEIYQNVNLMEALGKFHEKWGGEFLYDNRKLWVMQSAGSDHGALVEYGRNITGVEYSVDMTGVATRLIPYGYNGVMMSGYSPWVDSPLRTSYPKVMIRAVQFDNIKMADDASEEDLTDESITICATQAALDTALRAACMDLYSKGKDKPTVSMSIDMVSLADTEEYKSISALETVRLGDTVHCKHGKLGVVSDAKVVGITWDCCRDMVSSVVLGDFSYDFVRDGLEEISKGLEEVLANLNPDGSLMAERVHGILDGMNTQLKAQYTAAKRQDVIAILFENTDQSSPLYGALAIGTQGWQIADSKDANGQWQWKTAATAKGIYGDAIITGLLADATGYNYWDLDTGEFAIGSTVHVDDTTGGVTIRAYAQNGATIEETFYLNSSTGTVRINANSFSLQGTDIRNVAQASGQAGANAALANYDPMDHTTQADVFNVLSNNGAVRGLWLLNGQLYFSFDYAQGGMLKLGGPNNGNGELAVYNSSNDEICHMDNNKIRFCTSTGWNGEVLEIEDSILKGYVANTQYGLIDLCAQYGGTSGNPEYIAAVFGSTSAARKTIIQGNKIFFDGDVENTTFCESVEITGQNSNGYSLTVGHNLYAVGYVTATSFPTHSDRRLKKNIEPLPDGSVIDNLEPVSFDWKDGSGHVSAGLIAQQVQEICPDMVTETNGILSIDYNQVVSHLVKKVQDLEARLARLEEIINGQ